MEALTDEQVHVLTGLHAQVLEALQETEVRRFLAFA